ncbi:Zinc finger, RING/FYVE/PHD-type [Artemisia annua]|uniref:RING-type E3 ubiquitin transferase n=1 Tax=Artemisia annua TaxID=35608 RepID=A0A2U1NGH3_ARTAN|nr:Zinc finger, RING/FYVE/PHD-type [Artemisia annua]
MQYPVVSEEHQPLSSRNGAASAFPVGLLVDTNLDTSIPDTYRLPPAPLPYDSNPENPQGQVNISSENVADEAKESDCKGKTSFELIATEDVDAEIEEIKKSNTTFIAPEECPTCFEEYDEENPKIITKCEHHFHLSCILEWMERSDTCPVCDQEMEVNLPIDD